VEDCDVIYARAKWHHWSGGRVFNMRGEGGRAAGAGVIFRNINIEFVDGLIFAPNAVSKP
jgi:hypothetical protein